MFIVYIIEKFANFEKLKFVTGGGQCPIPPPCNLHLLPIWDHMRETGLGKLQVLLL